MEQVNKDFFLVRTATQAVPTPKESSGGGGSQQRVQGLWLGWQPEGSDGAEVSTGMVCGIILNCLAV